jgi:penicillin-binding protein 2
MSVRLNRTTKEALTILDKRVGLASVAVMVVLAILILRLWHLQIYMGDTYADLSKNNRIRVRLISPLRGGIFDRNGNLMVSNRPSFKVCVDLDEGKDWNRLAHLLAPVIGMNEEEILARIDTGDRNYFQNSTCLKSDISWEELCWIETNKYELPGVNIEVEPRRDYIFPGLAGHLIGFLGEINKIELEKSCHSDALPGDYVGKSGVEKTFGAFLQGRKGGRQVEVDASGREVKTVSRIEPLSGDNVYLTLDLALQQAVQAELEGKAGAIVAMRPSTGEILAMASSPTFDQNRFGKGMSSQFWKELVTNPLKPLQDRTIQGQYSPGSVFKIIMALAGLHEGVINEKTVLTCGGQYCLGTTCFHCWKKGGHGSITVHDAIVQSCDVFFYQVGRMLGVDRIAKYARMFGLSERTNICLTNEMPGLIPSSAWKLSHFNVPWQKGETLSLAIGQGFSLVTPLQLAVAISAIANGGFIVQPQLVKKIESPGGVTVQEFQSQIVRKLPFSPKHLETIRLALKDVVNSPRGTGSLARLKEIAVAGKTGTVQVIALKDPLRREKLEELPYDQRDHAWFACFAPYENSDIALIVLIEHGGHGGSAAAPIACRILKSYFKCHEADLLT